MAKKRGRYADKWRWVFIKFLRERGLQFTPDGFRDEAHMFGWLWDCDAHFGDGWDEGED